MSLQYIANVIKFIFDTEHYGNLCSVVVICVCFNVNIFNWGTSMVFLWFSALAHFV